MPYKKTTNDWNTKHGECFVKFTEPGKDPVAAFILGFETYASMIEKPAPAGIYASDDVFVRLKVWESARKYRYETVFCEDSQVGYEFPALGVTTYREGFITLIRRTRLDSPTKYRQSICNGAVSVLDMCSSETSSIRPAVSNFTLDVATHVFNPVYYSIEELTNDIYNLRRIGGALSLEYGVKIGRWSNKLELWKNSKFIGFVDDGVVMLPDSLMDLTEEIESFGMKVKYTAVKELEIKPAIKPKTSAVKFVATPGGWATIGGTAVGTDTPAFVTTTQTSNW